MLKPFDDGKRGRSRTKCRREERECNTTRIANARERKPFPRYKYVELDGICRRGYTKLKRSGQVNYTLIPRNREYTPRIVTKNGYNSAQLKREAKRDPDTELNYLKLAFKLHLESNYLKRACVRALPPAPPKITRTSSFPRMSFYNKKYQGNSPNLQSIIPINLY